ncbi:hypothetical protein [Mesorhizobium sp. IMUNJ 23232]|uniref:hypothetical protein n=1 Tax=Mesorhizobium sp. IMUNJ 23232 TaxID=3376064 RepID=UPI0037B57366
MRGQVSGTYLVSSIAEVFAWRAVRGAPAGAIERLADKALLNPEIAREFLRDNNPANCAALARKAKGWFGNEASTFLNMLDDNDLDDDLKAKVMEGAGAGEWDWSRYAVGGATRRLDREALDNAFRLNVLDFRVVAK